jgi:hypothetical protein
MPRRIPVEALHRFGPALLLEKLRDLIEQRRILRFPRGRATSRAAGQPRGPLGKDRRPDRAPEEHIRVLGPNTGTNASFPALRIMFLFYSNAAGIAGSWVETMRKGKDRLEGALSEIRSGVLLRQLREQQSHFSSDAVATSREGHRLPVSNRGGQRRRWGRGQLPFVQIESAPRPLTQLYL